MRVVSVNVAKAHPINTKSGKTGIYKLPIADPVSITMDGLEGDAIVDTENHGGVDQAVYIYGIPDYEWWSAELKQPLPPGTFGENITISQLESSSLCIGDQFHIGTVILEVTAPRIPCVTLATRMNDPQFVKRFVQAERYGAYCRVIQTGQIQTGIPVSITPYAGERISINGLADAFYSPSLSKERIQRLLDLPIDVRSRIYFKEKLLEMM